LILHALFLVYLVCSDGKSTIVLARFSAARLRMSGRWFRVILPHHLSMKMWQMQFDMNTYRQPHKTKLVLSAACETAENASTVLLGHPQKVTIRANVGCLLWEARVEIFGAALKVGARVSADGALLLAVEQDCGLAAGIHIVVIRAAMYKECCIAIGKLWINRYGRTSGDVIPTSGDM
jgi:hypothetical protein